MTWKTYLHIAIFLLLILGVACVAKAEGEMTSPLMSLVGKEKKNLATVIGERTSKPVALFFWASWCASCSENIKALAAKLAKDTFAGQVVGVSVDTSLEQALSYFDNKDLGPFQANSYLDVGADLAETLKLSGIPAVVVFKGQEKILVMDQKFDLDQVVRALEQP